MSNAIFPTLVGLTFPIKRKPQHKTLIQQAASGREVRAMLRVYPLYEWELYFEYLNANAAVQDWQNLFGFFNQRHGSFDDFVLTDTADQTVTDMQFATANGTQTAFQLTRTLGGFVDPVTDLQAAPVIKDNGVVVGSGYSVGLNNSGVVTFTAAPTAGHILTWSGSYRWRVRFRDDEQEFDRFTNDFWENQSVGLVTARG